MNNNSTSQYMDKQIMDLTNSQSSAAGISNSSGGNNDFIDFMNREPEKKEDIVPSYDFMPIRPAVRSSSPPAPRASNFDSGDDDAPIRTWNSVDSKSNSSPIRNYSSLNADEPSKFILGKNSKPSNVPLDVSLISEIDRTMKKYVDNLMHAVDSMSTRLTQLETRTRNLENSIDDLKVSVGDNHGSTDGKMRLLENILREVQSSVLLVKDKQEILDAQLQIAKLQIPKADPEESKTIPQADSTKTGVSTNQISNVSPAQPPFPTPNAPPQQNLLPQVPNQFPQNQLPSIPQRDSYFSPPGHTPENPTQQYQIPPPLQLQHQPAPPPAQHQPVPPPPQLQSAPPPPQLQSAPPPQHQYQSPPQPQYPQSPTPSQPHPPFSAANPGLPQPPVGHHPEDTQYIPPQTYQPTIRPPTSHPPPSGGPPLPSQQYYGPNPSMYEPSSRPGPGFSGSFGPSSGHVEPYSYSSSPMKPQQHPSPGMGQSSGSGYPQLPTARILPQALPTASAVSGSSGSSGSGGGSGNRVPIDDVVDRVTNMGFPREQVRATVRKLTENGQAVDLNVVLDKLMNDGDGQGARGWFGR